MIKHETHTRSELGANSNVEFGLEGDCCQKFKTLVKHSHYSHILDASH